MITNDVPNGTILTVGAFAEHILVVETNGLGKWGYSLKYDDCWLNPNDALPPICYYTGFNISLDWILKAKIKLKFLYNRKFMNNLDYIEALAKLKEYESDMR